MLGFPYFHVKIFATTCQGLVGRVISQIPWDIVPCEYFKGDLQFRLWQRVHHYSHIKNIYNCLLGLINGEIPSGFSTMWVVDTNPFNTKKDEEHHQTLMSQPSVLSRQQLSGSILVVDTSYLADLW